MPERIINGDFSHGFDDWTNPTGGAQAFTMDAGKAKAISSATVVTPIEHSMLQGFANLNYVLSGKISVWGQWNVPSGNVSNGSCRFRVRLKDPTDVTHTLLDTTKPPGSSSGWLLQNEDITAKFGSYGNFVLKLDCYPASAKASVSAGAANPYTAWTKGGGPWGALGQANTYDADSKWKAWSYEASANDVYAWTEKTFVVDKATYDSRITAQVKGLKEAPVAGVAEGKVILVKPNASEVVLWEGSYSDDDWHTPLNNLDITSHVQTTGTYKLKLWAHVRSYYAPIEETWYHAYFHFNDVSLTANCYEYTQAQGWFDNISIILLCRYYKTIKENLGAGEVQAKKAMLTRKEDIALSESLSHQVFKAKVIKEDLGLKETYWRKVFKTVKEDLGLSESYYVPNAFKMVKEDLGLSETYFTNRRVPKMVKEDLGLREKLLARITRRNVVITYDLTTKTDWNIRPPVTTPWIKRKVEVK